jgi:hypothetical protein
MRATIRHSAAIEADVARGVELLAKPVEFIKPIEWLHVAV